MRLARALLFLALSGAVAHADDARPADAPATASDAAPAEAHTKVPLRVVRMLPDTHQALLFDRAKGTHVVVEAGQAVEGFLVDSIDADEVTLLSDNGATFVLAAPEPAWRHHRGDGHPTVGGNGREWRDTRGGRTAEARSSDARAADTRANGAANPGEPQPADPYAEDVAPGEIGTGADGVRVVEAPDAPAFGSAPMSSSVIGTGADGVRVVEAPSAPAAAVPSAATAPASGQVTAPAPATATATAPAAATATVPVPAAVSATGPAAATVPVPVPVPAAAAAAATATAPAAASATASAPAAALPSDPTGDALAAALTGAPASATPPSAGAATAAPSASAATAIPSSTAGVVLARTDVHAALGNFGTLAASIHGAFTASGVRVDSVATGSLFAKAGLRAGDLISSVDGVPLRSLDDAADLYARAASARNISVAIVRAGTPATLRVTIQ